MLDPLSPDPEAGISLSFCCLRSQNCIDRALATFVWSVIPYGGVTARDFPTIIGGCVPGFALIFAVCIIGQATTLPQISLSTFVGL